VTGSFEETKKKSKVNTSSFAEYAVKNFDPAKVASVLIDQSDDTFGLKVVAFAGLRAWTMAPNDPALIKDAMILKTQQKYRSMVRNHRHSEKLPPYLREASALKSEKYQSFFKDVRQPLLSARSERERRSLKELKAVLNKRFGETRFLFNFMDLMHYAALLAPKEKYRAPSVKRAKEIFALLSRNQAADGKPSEAFERRGGSGPLVSRTAIHCILICSFQGQNREGQLS
jgi:hypothetical protein